jgi:hypothetical protein
MKVQYSFQPRSWKLLEVVMIDDSQGHSAPSNSWQYSSSYDASSNLRQIDRSILLSVDPAFVALEGPRQEKSMIHEARSFSQRTALLTGGSRVVVVVNTVVIAYGLRLV